MGLSSDGYVAGTAFDNENIIGQQWALMLTSPLCGFMMRGERQPLSMSGGRVFRCPHNHSALRKSISESGAR